MYYCMEKESRFKKIFKKKWLWVTLVLLVLVVGGVYARSRQPEIPEYSSAPVEKMTLIQSVNETGSLVSSLEVTYSWETSGKIVHVKKKVGDTVKKGEVIAEVDSKAQKARLGEAYAALQAAQARLNLELAGPNEEDRKKSLASVTQAKTSLAQAEASLEKAKTTATSQITTAEKAVETAFNNLKYAENGGTSQLVADAYEDLANSITDAAVELTKALGSSDNVLGIDNVFANDDFEDVLSTTNLSRLNLAKNSYYGAKQATAGIQAKVSSLFPATDYVALQQTANETTTALNVMQLHLLDVQGALDATLPIGDLSQSELDTLKTSISTARSAISSDMTAITNAKQGITSAENSLTNYKIAYAKAEQDLANIKAQTSADIKIAESQVAIQLAALAQAEAAHDSFVAPPRTVDVASLKADVQRQTAAVAAMQAEVQKTNITALAPGVVAKIDLKIGEVANMGQTAVVVVSPDFNVEVDISESDIAKVQLGDTAHFTFDALRDDEIYTGEVVAIDSAKTEISGVIYYKTKILLHGRLNEEKMEIATSTTPTSSITTDVLTDLKSGMTVNVQIFTDSKAGVLVVPQRAVLEKNGQQIVRVLTNPVLVEYEERIVTTGLRGDEGLIEITSGLSEGEEVITFIDETE